MEKNHFVLASLYRLKMVQIDEYACLKFSFHHILIESEKNMIFVKNLRYQAFYEILCQSSRLSKWKRIKYISKLQGRFFSSIFPLNYMYIQFQWMAHGFFVFTTFFSRYCFKSFPKTHISRSQYENNVSKIHTKAKAHYSPTIFIKGRLMI